MFVKLYFISHEKGHVEHTNNEFDDADAASTFAGVWIWSSVPSRGQNHIFAIEFFVQICDDGCSVVNLFDEINTGKRL